eukprot:scaffold37924_cov178-Skeletonema_dohrnii-CCMP3373.AAC.3
MAAICATQKTRNRQLRFPLAETASAATFYHQCKCHSKDHQWKYVRRGQQRSKIFSLTVGVEMVMQLFWVIRWKKQCRVIMWNAVSAGK